jgi:type I restriction enzyme S subunit
MDAQQFLAEFGRIANAPEGVAQLRELILQLAISGRLTERVPGETTAGALIERNRERQKALIAQKALKRQPDLKHVTKSDKPWELPDGWVWTRLGYVTNYGDAPKVEFEDVSEDTWVLELEDIEKGTSKLLSKILARERKFKSTKNRFPAGAVLYGKLRPYLDKVLIAESSGVCTTEISPISFFEHIEAGYLRWYLKSPYFIAYADGSTYGMNLPRLGTDSAREALFPFPPQKEQSRIVSKVDELMALCDQLVAQQQSRRKLQNALRQSTLRALAGAQSPHELQASSRRLQTNFGRLLSEPGDVAELRDIRHGNARLSSPSRRLEWFGC